MTAQLQSITPVARVAEAPGGQTYILVEEIDGFGVRFQEVVGIPYQILRVAFANNTAQDYQEGYDSGWESAQQDRDLDEQEDVDADKVLAVMDAAVSDSITRAPQMGDPGYVMREDANGNRALVYDPEAYEKITAHQ